MCDEGATNTRRILPNVPVRQWVLSLPIELRGLAATKPDVMTALGRIVAEEIARATKCLAGVDGAETGAVSFPRIRGSVARSIFTSTFIRWPFDASECYRSGLRRRLRAASRRCGGNAPRSRGPGRGVRRRVGYAEGARAAA